MQKHAGTIVGFAVIAALILAGVGINKWNTQENNQIKRQVLMGQMQCKRIAFLPDQTEIFLCPDNNVYRLADVRFGPNFSKQPPPKRQETPNT